MSDRGTLRQGLLLRLIGRLYAWAAERDGARMRRENPEWWARVQERYRLTDRGR